MSTPPAGHEFVCAKCGECCIEFSVNTTLPEKLKQFLQTRNRRPFGIWHMTKNGDIKLILPFPCRHLTHDNLCDIQTNKPEYCKIYYCGKHIVPSHKSDRPSDVKPETTKGR